MKNGRVYFFALLGVLLIGGLTIFIWGNQGVTDLNNNKTMTSFNAPERVTLTTTDKVTIVGDWYGADKPNGQAVVLLHAMNKDRQSWVKFAKFLSEAGYATLAIDLKGHGESVNQEVDGENIALDYRRFNDEEHQSSIKDVLAALDFVVKEKKVTRENITMIGASIGANLALEALQSDPRITGAVLLSPGLDYRGIKAESLVKQLPPQKRLFMLAGGADAYSANSVRELSQTTSAETTTRVFTNPRTGHGTDMFDTEPDLANMILSWLTKSLEEK